MNGVLKPYRIALDFDGVVLESVFVKLNAFHRMFAKFPQKMEICKYLDANTGISRYVKFRHIYEKILSLSYDEACEQELDHRYSSMVLDGVLHSPFVIGAEDFLAHCPVPIDIVSAMPLTELRLIVERRGILDRFQGLYGAPGRKSEQLASILKLHGLNAAQLLFVGDSAEDAVAARAAGVSFVGRVNRDNPFDFPPPRIVDLAELRGLMGFSTARSSS